ncbi:MAG: hypothetical protein QOH72_3962 [Solirubrobacteraceae bacterium]|jgi:hypothetical protein|nr:hypothetical protein [Solirubrobacteraceae bacterium]
MTTAALAPRAVGGLRATVRLGDDRAELQSRPPRSERWVDSLEDVMGTPEQLARWTTELRDR